MLSREKQEQILKYCIDNNIRLPNLECYLTDPGICYYYARYILKSRFELGEKFISENTGYSLKYAEDVLKGKFSLGEKNISNNGWYSYYYAMNILQSRFELGEPIIKNSTHWGKYKKYFKIKD